MLSDEEQEEEGSFIDVNSMLSSSQKFQQIPLSSNNAIIDSPMVEESCYASNYSFGVNSNQVSPARPHVYSHSK